MHNIGAIDALKSNGVVMFEAEARQLRELTPLLSAIAGRNLEASKSDYLGEPNSLTPKNWLSHGHQSYELPLHTDYPDYLLPPRFVSLTCLSTGKVPVETVFYDIMSSNLSQSDINVLLNEPWITTGGIGRARSSRVLQYHDQTGALMLRYASNVMRPFSKKGSLAVKVLFDAVERVSPLGFVLSKGQTVVWDNWRMLHGRREAASSPKMWTSGEERRLERIKWI